MRIALLLALITMMSGCASGLKRTQVPDAGRYAVVVLHSDSINLHYSGSWPGYVWSIDAKHDVRERYKTAIVEALAEVRDYEFVAVDYSSLERFHDPERYDWEFDVYNARYTADHESLQVALPGFLKENDLDFAIIIREVSAPNMATGSTAIMQGAGACVTWFPEQLTIFSNYELQLVDAATGLSAFARARIYKILDNPDLISLERDTPPEAAAVATVADQVESIITPESLEYILCKVGLIPMPSSVPQSYVLKQCEKMFPMNPYDAAEKY